MLIFLLQVTVWICINDLHFIFQFQILAADRLSNRICHACISFLNSWQSFKNRCFAAQKKQQNFLDLLLAKERAKQKLEKERQRQLPQADTSTNNDLQKILKNALLNSTIRSNAANNSSIDVVSVNSFSFEQSIFHWVKISRYDAFFRASSKKNRKTFRAMSMKWIQHNF